ncbi:twin-arginine translocase TatA/TatE family subunit [Verrucomicrobiota bacterium]
MPELIFILVIGLMVLGPQKLPEIMRALGKGIIQFKRALNADDEDEKEAGDSEADPEDGTDSDPQEKLHG